MIKRCFILIFSVTLLLSAHGASRIHCDSCSKQIRGRYNMLNNKKYCSSACLQMALPRCIVCNKKVNTEYRINKKGEAICSAACETKLLPRCEACGEHSRTIFKINTHLYCKKCTLSGKSCFSCNRPARFYTEIDDKRAICTDCNRWAVKTQEHAEKNYDRARRQLESWTKIPLKTVPPLELVDLKNMAKHSKNLRKTDSAVVIRGLYSRQTTRLAFKGLAKFFKKEEITEKEAIYIIDHLHDEVFRVAALHELMHDLIYEQFNHLMEAPLWVQEGICQFAAAEFCRRKVFSESLYAIEQSQDPDYGDGYRYIKAQIGMRGWPALKTWMTNADPHAFPQKAPKVGD